MFFDTETYAADCPEGESHTLRLWSARLDVRRSRHASQLGTARGWGYDTAELADQVDLWTQGQRTLWVYAHNLSFDLAVTRLPAELAARGWAVTGHAVASDSPWLRMKRGQCVLTFCDSWGWLRAPLDAIGADVGYTKPDLPARDDDTGLWRERCQADTEILALAMLALMDWWDGQQLGSWTLTGSAGGWNTWRHRTTCPLPLIVADETQTAHDREAIYGGRREAFRHGELKGGPWRLLDFASAYPTVAAHFPLPAARQGDFDTLPVDSPLILGDRFGVIARCVVKVAEPRYPVRVAGRIAYPVGEFATTLAGPELAEARARGELVSIGYGYLHKLAPHMAEWARWVLRVTAADSDEIPAVCRRAVKHWGRAVIGKTAAKGWRTIPLETLGGTGWDYRPAWNAHLGAQSHLVDVCGQAAEIIADGDGDNAYPAILAWVESWTRVYLSRAIDALMPLGVACCDTDGLIVAAAGDWQAELPATLLGPLTLRPKGIYKTLTVLGPQHMTAPGDRKLSGIPRSAELGEDGSLSALLWPKLATQMALRPGTATAEYVRPRQTFTVANSYVTGNVSATGFVYPLLAQLCVHGATHLSSLKGADAELFPPQLQASHIAQMVNPIPPGGHECSYHMPKSNGTIGESRRSGQTVLSKSHRSPTRPGAGKRRSWPDCGRILSGLVRSVFSGKTRTL